MTRKKRSEEDLREASNFLIYEMWMLKAVTRGLARGIAKEAFIKNALLDSFTIHARALVDFLYGAGKAWPDDVLAEDYLAYSEREWQEIRPPKTELLETINHRVAKQAAHLSYDRMDFTSSKKKWPYWRITQDVLEVLDRFLEVVPPHLLGTRWDDWKRQQAEIDSDTST